MKFTLPILKEYVTKHILTSRLREHLFESLSYIRTPSEFFGSDMYESFLDYAESHPTLSPYIDALEDVGNTGVFHGIKEFEPEFVSAGDDSDNSMLLALDLSGTDELLVFMYEPHDGWNDYGTKTKAEWGNTTHPRYEQQLTHASEDGYTSDEIVEMFAKRFGLLHVSANADAGPGHGEDNLGQFVGDQNNDNNNMIAQINADIGPPEAGTIRLLVGGMWGEDTHFDVTSAAHSRAGNVQYPTGIPYYDPIEREVPGWGPGLYKFRSHMVDELYGAATLGGTIYNGEMMAMPGLFATPQGTLAYIPHGSMTNFSANEWGGSDDISKADALKLIQAPASVDFRTLKYYAKKHGIINWGADEPEWLKNPGAINTRQIAPNEALPLEFDD